MLEFLLVSFTAAAFFLPFLSIQHNPNGINEAIGVEAGGPALFTHNHMLYRPVGLVVWKGLQFFGFGGRALSILQILSGLAGALAVGSAYMAYRSLFRGRFPAALGAGFLGGSCYFWASSVDAFYIAPAAMLAAAAFASIVVLGSPLRKAVLCGGFSGLAVLVWQANVILLPVMALGIWSINRNRAIRFRALAVFGGVAVSSIVLAYGSVAVFSFGHRTPASVMRWVTTYGGARLPLWGAWDSSRIAIAGDSAVASIVPIKHLGGVGGVIRRGLSPETALPLLSLFALAVLVVLIIWGLLFQPGRRGRMQTHLWPALGYFGFVPFVIWWDPFEPKWFVVANVFLSALIAGGVASAGRRRSIPAVATVCVLVISFSTFATVIRPRHLELSSRQLQAHCVGEHLNSDDVFVATDWKWDAYLKYFYGLRVVSVIGLASRTANKEALMNTLERKFESIEAGESKAYMVDLDSYTTGYLRWLEAQTGLVKEDLELFQGIEIFECEGAPIRRVDFRGTTSQVGE